MFNLRSLLISVTLASGLLSSVAVASKRQCASHPSPEKIREAEAHFSANRVAVPTNRMATTFVNVYFHVISDEDENQTGDVGDDVIQTQMDVLNNGFSGTDLIFQLQSINRVSNSNWFNNAGPNSTVTMQVQTEMKQQLRQGGAGDLNVYTVGFSAEENQGILGYATFPYDYENDPDDDGVVLVYVSLPGLNDGPYNEGKTLVHETGHWTGLYHVFQGGCTGEGDQVADTPPQEDATDGCPANNKDTCSGGGLDSIHNYMDYSDDECLNSFTNGQIDRLWGQISAYRGLQED